MRNMPRERTDLKCPDCGAFMILRPSRYGPFYGCSEYPQCKATHGAHPDGAPLGVPASAHVKRCRIKAHEVFDQLWKNADQLQCYNPESEEARKRILNAARNRAYRWLAEQMDREEVHIGEMGEDECFMVEQLCEGIDAAAVRRWHKRQSFAKAVSR